MNLILPFTEEDYDKSRGYFDNINRVSGFIAERALYRAYGKEWEHSYEEVDIQLYNADIQIKSRVASPIPKRHFITHQEKGYKTTRGFIFGEVCYDSSGCTGSFEIYPYIFATKYILSNSQDLVRGHHNFGQHIHEDLLKNCPNEHKFQIKKNHLIGLE